MSHLTHRMSCPTPSGVLFGPDARGATVTFWRDPELPAVERMPRRRATSSPSLGGRTIAGLAGLVLLASGAIGVWQSLGSGGSGSPIGAFAVLLPASILIRYAATGRIVKP